MKLDNLCAIKVMGWKKFHEGTPAENFWGEVNPQTGGLYRETKRLHEWNPSTSLDDALVCLERAAPAGTWYCNKNATEVPERQYWAADSAKHEAYASTAALAMCICALRAMGVPESEISLAMGEK